MQWREITYCLGIHLLELQEYGRTSSCRVTLYFIVSFYVIVTVFKYQNPQHWYQEWLFNHFSVLVVKF